MDKGSRRVPRSRVQHLKYAGITQKTLDPYREQVRLGAPAAEYVNHMYQEGEPHGYATIFAS
eukprot:1767110-Pyramimonas_sp.AAC.1